MKNYLIIGNGVAGTTAAEEIRKHDGHGAITILTEESLPFYYRIRLNDYIGGEIDEAALIAKKPEWYAEHRIPLQTGVKATGAEPDQRVIVTSSNERLPYDALLIATGSRSFVPPIQGADKPGVFTIRTIADARQIISYCEKVNRVVLIGGGLLGLEAGKAFLRRGKQVTVVEFFQRLLPRQLDARGAERLQAILEGMGFAFHLGASSKEITGTTGPEGVVLADGQVLPAEMVIISAGVRPSLDLADGLGLVCNKGILVDNTLRTNRPEIFAAGDVAEFNGVIHGIWPTAMQQGKAAGANMAGVETTYQAAINANKLKVVGIDLGSAGEIDGDNRFHAKIEENEAVYKKIIYNDDRQVIGCIMLGDTANFSAITRAINDKKLIDEV